MVRSIRIVFVAFLLITGCRREPDAHAHAAAEAPPSTPPADPHDPERTASRDLELGGTYLTNRTAYVPVQCYTRTRDANGRVHDPCYACHQASVAPNYVDDADLQLSYSLPESALANPWSNLFVDRTREVAATSDAEIAAYIARDNYHDADGSPTLARTLGQVPGGWDVDDDGEWDGYVPDARFHFDERGFDRTPEGGYTGWRAFAYFPFLGTFFPTNGSTDDVLIRLPIPFRTREDGTFDAGIYEVNLAVVEAVVRREDVPIEPTDERALGVDLDGDRRLGRATRVAFVREPGRLLPLVGAAMQVQREGQPVAYPGLFPAGTEFLHSVRYVDVADDGDVRLSPRMKELRYARKRLLLSWGDLEQIALHEAREARGNSDEVHPVAGDPERGVSNGLGWIYQGFIEDRDGELRPQTFEEHVACVGCHGGLGATTDGVFSFPRKLGFEAFQHGWFHPSQRSLRGVPDPVRADGQREYATYLRTNGAADELRANDEARARFFAPDGTERAEAFAELARDVGALLFPSRARAMLLAKAYRVIVLAQSFRAGRDATVRSPTEVHRELDAGTPTGIARAAPGPGTLHAPEP